MSKAIRSPITPPSRPSVTNLTGRRAAFGLFGTALLAATSVRAASNPEACAPLPVAPSPDAELIRLCDAFNTLEAKVKAAYYGPDRIEGDRERDDFLDPIRDAQEELLQQIVPIRATTVQGIVARAVMYTTWDEEFPRRWDELGGWDDGMVYALVRDAAALSGPLGAAWPASAEREGA